MTKLLLLASAMTILPQVSAVPKAFFAGEAPSPELRPAARAPSRTAFGAVVERADDGLFYVEAQVNGTPIQFVVDSGSSLVILNASDAKRAGVTGGPGVDVATAGGAAAMQRARIDRVALAGRTLSGVEAVVMKRNLEVSLLGQNVLSQLDSVTFKGDRLELN